MVHMRPSPMESCLSTLINNHYEVMHFEYSDAK